MTINWSRLSRCTGIPLSALVAVYGDKPISCLTAAEIVSDLDVRFGDVLTAQG